MRLSCWSSMFNEIWPEPTNKRFNSAYLKIKYLISKKNSQLYIVTRQNFFLLITSHHDGLQKLICWKPKKMAWDFHLGTPHRQAHQAKKTRSSWKIIEVTHLRKSGYGRGSGVIIIWFKKKSSKFLILSTDVPRRRSAPEFAARWRYRLPSNNLTAHNNSKSAFILVLTRKPKNASKRVWIGPEHTSVHFKSLFGCLPINSWSCVHPLYAGKRL